MGDGSARRTTRPALAAFAVCIAALAAAPIVFPSTDGLYALAWGSQLAHLHRAGIDAATVPVAHPLSILAGLLLSPLGTDSARYGFSALSLISYAGLGYASFRLGRILAGALAGCVAAALVLSRAKVVVLTLGAVIDVPFAALVILAASYAAEAPERNRWRVLALLAFAGLLRPEAWALSVLYGCWLALRLDGRERIAVLALAMSAPIAWTLFDAVLTGDPLGVVHSASAGRGFKGAGYPLAISQHAAAIEVLVHVRAGVPGAIGWPLTLIGAAGGAFVIVRRRRPRAGAPPGAPAVGINRFEPATVIAAITLAGIATTAILALFGLKLAPRFLLAPALGLAVLAVVLFREVRGAGAAALAAILVLAAVPSTFHHVDRTRDARLTYRGTVRGATVLVGYPAVRAAISKCRGLAIGGAPRRWASAARPAVADQLGRDPSSIRLHRQLKTGHGTSVLLHRKTARPGIWSFFSPCLGRAHRHRGPQGRVLGTGLGG